MMDGDRVNLEQERVLYFTSLLAGETTTNEGNEDGHTSPRSKFVACARVRCASSNLQEYHPGE